MSGCVCQKVKEMGTFLGLQVNELNEKMSFKIGVNFTSSVYVGEDFLEVRHICTCEGTEREL